MSTRRKLLAVVCLVLVPGSVTATLAYALHLRSHAYRQSIERGLEDWLGMSVTIGAVRPLTLDSRVLEDVHVLLEEQGSEVFKCAQATWRTSSAEHSQRFVLELSDGWLLAGSAGWRKPDYQRMLAGGLGHDFAEIGLDEVRLEGIDVIFDHPLARFTAEAASGVVSFDDSGNGQAALTCYILNGVRVDHPVGISLRFTPGDRLVFHEIRLSVPTIPLTSLGLDRLLDGPVSCGEFTGTIIYRRQSETETVDVTGAIHGADLAEITSQLAGGPYQGKIDVDINSASFSNRKLNQFDLHGRLSDLRLGEIVPGLIEPATTGLFQLNIDRMHWLEGKLLYLKANGACHDLSLDALSALWGKGTITGSANLIVHSLLMIDDQVNSADLQIDASPPESAPGLIDRAIVARAAQKWLGIELSAALPEEIEYAQLGARLILNDGRLQVLGTHGADQQTILTVKLLGQPWGIIKQPTQTFPLPDLVSLLRERAGDVDSDQIRAWWQGLQPPKDEPRP